MDKIQISRARWANGDNATSGKLWHGPSRHGKQDHCCVGLVLNQMGVPDELMLGIGTLNELFSNSATINWISSQSFETLEKLMSLVTMERVYNGMFSITPLCRYHCQVVRGMERIYDTNDRDRDAAVIQNSLLFKHDPIHAKTLEFLPRKGDSLDASRDVILTQLFKNIGLEVEFVD